MKNSKIIALAIVIICGAIAILFYVQPSKAELEQKRIAELIAMGDQEITMTEFLKGNDTLKSKATEIADDRLWTMRSCVNRLGYSPYDITLPCKVMEKAITCDSLAEEWFFRHGGNPLCMKELFVCFSDTMRISMLNYVQDHYLKHRGWSSETWALEWMYFLDKQNLSEKIDTLPHDIMVTLLSNLCVPLNDTIMATKIASHLNNKEIIVGAWWNEKITGFLSEERSLIVQNGMDKIKQDLRENPPFTVMTFRKK